MEEIVRAFNYVIEKGWVSPVGVQSMTYVPHFYLRHSTGQRQSGLPATSRKHIVSASRHFF